MNACSPICLVDLVPALRWSKPADVDPFLRHPRLAETWWDSLPVTRAVEVVGATWLANSLTRLLTQQWDHLPLRDLLPPLRTAVSGGLAAEPVHTVVITTAGDWERVLDTPLATVTTWAFPSDCDAIAVLSTAVLHAVEPYADGPAARPPGPSPSPGLIVEAIRTIANWMPESSPAHVHQALSYLASATGAEPVQHGAPGAEAAGAGTALGPGDTVPDGHGHAASRALRTLRALRADREQRDQQDGEAQTTPPPSGSPGTPLIGPDGAMRRPDFGPPRASRAYVEPRDNHSELTVPTPLPPPPANLTERPLIATVDQLFRGWEPLERTVAAERLFPAEPVSIRVLAGRVGVDVDRIRSAQRTAEERIVRWLSSPGGTVVTQHLLAVAERIGTAATLDHLIAAHSEHPVEIPALGAPLWRVIVALFTDRRMYDGWLIAGDPHQLRWHTRQLLGGQPTLEEAGALLGQQLGIRPQALRAWLLSLPGVTVSGEQVLLDTRPGTQPPSPPLGVAPRVPGMPEGTGVTTANGLPIRRRSGAMPTEETHAPPQPGIAESARCFRAPDGRWWHRVDVTADHLNGAPATVPTGFAAHLGLNPGQLLCLTAPGADLLVLVWRDQPAFDSLRPLLRRLSAQPGDRIFITIDGDRLDARRLASAEVAQDGPTGKALHLLGYTAAATPEAALEIIGHRICPDGAQPSTDAASVLEMLERRGDSDIVAELRPALYIPAHLTR